MTGQLLSLNVARAAEIEIDGRRVLSSIGKRPIAAALAVGPRGLAEDEQADLSVHGGLSKALYAYPSEHFAFWQTVRAQAGAAGWAEPIAPGTMGENLTLAGLLENQVWIGDVLRFPNCSLAVSEPRFPCFKFNAAMGFKQAAAMMNANAWCGFYLAVRDPGSLQAADPFELVPGPREVGIAELFRARAGGASG